MRTIAGIAKRIWWVKWWINTVGSSCIWCVRAISQWSSCIWSVDVRLWSWSSHSTGDCQYEYYLKWKNQLKKNVRIHCIFGGKIEYETMIYIHLIIQAKIFLNTIDTQICRLMTIREKKRLKKQNVWQKDLKCLKELEWWANFKLRNRFN